CEPHRSVCLSHRAAVGFPGCLVLSEWPPKGDLPITGQHVHQCPQRLIVDDYFLAAMEHMDSSFAPFPPPPRDAGGGASYIGKAVAQLSQFAFPFPYLGVTSYLISTCQLYRKRPLQFP